MNGRRATRRYQCPVELTLDVIGGKWKPRILWELRSGPKRFNVLLNTVPDIAHKVLTQQLRALEHDGLIVRRALDDGRRVEYALSEFGRTLRPSLDALAKWAKQHHREVHATLDWPG